ncbi:MAG: hypothetical protein CK427_11405 [Leptospira sp.]|nr:MAG: hypothetical protein CK427_11405 [Leptospira sp.]
MNTFNTIHLLFLIQEEDKYEELESALKDFDSKLVATRYKNLTSWLDTNPTKMPEIVISDYLPETEMGLDALEYFRNKNKDTIFILYTNMDFLQSAIDETKKGVSDYIIQNIPSRFAVVVNNSIEKIITRWDLLDNKNVIKRIEKKNTALLNAQPDYLIQANSKGIILDYKISTDSEIINLMLGKESIQGKILSEIFPQDTACLIQEEIKNVLTNNKLVNKSFYMNYASVNHNIEARFVKIDTDEVMIILREFSSDNQKEEDYYRAISRISRYRHKETLVKELLNHMVDSDKNLLAEEKKKADLLLSNILPGYMIEDLKRYGKVQPVQYDQVAVMFTDFVGFSKISRYMSPTQLLKELTIYFDEFERICEIYSIEKVKTIGDSFLCVAGLSGNHRTAGIDILLAGIEMMRFTDSRREELKLQGEDAWGIRLAIHSGPLIAGIVGHQKIAFDIWGHTVNIAARIEGVGKGGEITVSRNMFDFTRDLFDFDYIGERELKGVGMHDLYKLSGLKTGLYAKNDKTKFIPNVNFYKLFEALRDGKHIMRRDGKYIISKQSHDRELEAKKEILSNSL